MIVLPDMLIASEAHVFKIFNTEGMRPAHQREMAGRASYRLAPRQSLPARWTQVSRRDTSHQEFVLDTVLTIQTFRDSRLSRILDRRVPKGFPADLASVTRRKLIMLDCARALDDLQAPLANRLEALQGDRAGQLHDTMQDGANEQRGMVGNFARTFALAMKRMQPNPLYSSAIYRLSWSAKADHPRSHFKNVRRSLQAIRKTQHPSAQRSPQRPKMPSTSLF